MSKIQEIRVQTPQMSFQRTFGSEMLSRSYSQADEKTYPQADEKTYASSKGQVPLQMLPEKIPHKGSPAMH